MNSHHTERELGAELQAPRSWRRRASASSDSRHAEHHTHDERGHLCAWKWFKVRAGGAAVGALAMAAATELQSASIASAGRDEYLMGCGCVSVTHPRAADTDATSPSPSRSSDAAIAHKRCCAIIFSRRLQHHSSGLLGAVGIITSPACPAAQTRKTKTCAEWHRFCRKQPLIGASGGSQFVDERLSSAG